MPTALVVGATRGLGHSLAKLYSEKEYKVFGTSRSPQSSVVNNGITWISGVDVAQKTAGNTIVDGLEGSKPDVTIISAGYFGKESFDEPDWEAEVKMYTTSAIGPVFIVHALEKAGLFAKGSKIILISSESGSITLRHESEGGGNFAHHASKSALNMVGKLLSLDLKDKGIAVALLHPGFMRSEMTKGVGFDKFWDAGGAVEPEVAAKSILEWVDKFDIGRTGEYWAPRGPGDIGTAEAVLGPKDELPTPLQLPW
ncbi:NAD(P)-binding protein [Polychaeton citri CBS 116435]|uniref:NAD(P)-binding protein n=1 Tax=Polychaeton citri CBS 116435 TaxID=1314669 RepID=A0A9P4UIU2_9PEZI|nr:NAD(P)-binding protein [Polychaeton citri CBS 116435]